MKPKLKPRGTERLKLEYDEPPSNFAFKFDLRRYIKADHASVLRRPEGVAAEWPADLPGRTVQVDSIKTRVESA